MKILWVDLQKANDKNNTTEDRGLPKSRAGKYLAVSIFLNSCKTFQHLCGFQETRWEDGQNNFTRTNAKYDAPFRNALGTANLRASRET